MSLISILMIFCQCGNSSTRIGVSSQIKREFVEKMQKKDLRIFGIGGGELNGKTTLISVTFKINKLLSIDEARCLIVDAVSEILNITNKKTDAARFFNEFPVGPNIFDITIIGNSPQIGDLDHIETVSAARDMIFYYTHDPNPAILMYYTVHKESFEDAKKNVDDQKNCLNFQHDHTLIQ